MSKRLTRTTYAFDEDGRSHQFLPGQTLPSWAEKQVTNPRVFESDAASSKADPDAGGSPSYPEGEPSTSWTHDQLDAYAEANGIEWSTSALQKSEKVGEINGETARQ